MWADSAEGPPPSLLRDRSAFEASSGHCLLQDSGSLVLEVTSRGSIRPHHPALLWVLCLIKGISFDKAGCPL